jgi:hypothetical protein
MKLKNILLAVIAVAIAGIIIFLLTRTEEKPLSTQQISAGTLECYPDFPSKYIPARDVNVWLPKGYKTGDKCQVLYMHDGQMLFDANTTWNNQEWRVDEVISELIDNNTIKNTIVVAIDNTENRLNEYFPNKVIKYMPQNTTDFGPMSPLGDDYLKFIVHELKPFIDNKYQPLTDRDHTIIMGSSMGGLISLYAICEYPLVFGGAICMSTHLSFGSLPLGGNNDQWAQAFIKYLENNQPHINYNRIYMDCGTEGIDADYAPYQETVNILFNENVWDTEHFISLIFDGHDHNENCWAERLEVPFSFILSE